MIRVKLFGVLKKNMPEVDGEGFWNIDGDGMSIQSVLESAGVPETGLRYTLLVNRMRKDESYVLRDGDTLTVMPLIAGG